MRVALFDDGLDEGFYRLFVGEDTEYCARRCGCEGRADLIPPWPGASGTTILTTKSDQESSR